MSERDLDAILYQLLEGEAERGHADVLLDLYENAAERRQERDQALLGVLRRAHQAEVEKADAASGASDDADLGGDAA